LDGLIAEGISKIFLAYKLCKNFNYGSSEVKI